MMTVRNSAVGAVLIPLVVLIASCSDDSNPTAPSATQATTVSSSAASAGALLAGEEVDQVGIGAGVESDLDEALAAPDGSTLKAGAPTLVSPINNAVTDTLSPLLTLTNSSPNHVASAAFTYRFEVTQAGSSAIIDANSAAQGTNTTSYTVNLALEQATNYEWRARAELEGEAGPWSTTGTFTTPVLIGTPTPVSPANGATSGNFRPTFTVQNGDAPAGTTVTYQFQIDDESAAFPNPSTFTAPRSAGTQTTAQFEDALAPSTTFYWRVRGTDGTFNSDWSATQMFSTPAVNVGPRAAAASAPVPDQEAIINALAVSHAAELGDSCIEEGGSWDFMDEAIRQLRLTDTRWGYNCKRGNCNEISIDIANYFWGIGDGIDSQEVYIIDIISAVCPDGNQGPSWQDQTGATHEEGAVGVWIYPRPGE